MNIKQGREYWRRWGQALKAYCRENHIEKMSAVDATALRYRVHAAAGLPQSHLQFNGKGHTTAIFKRLAYMARTGDFENMIEINDPEDESTRTRCLWKIRQFSEDYYRPIVRDVTQGHTDDAEELTTPQLIGLARRLETLEREGKIQRVAHHIEGVPF